MCLQQGKKIVALTTTTYVAGAEHLSMLNRPTTSVIVAFNTEIHHFSTSMSLFPFKSSGLQSVSNPDAHVQLVITVLADVNESLLPLVFAVFDVVFAIRSDVNISIKHSLFFS